MEKQSKFYKTDAGQTIDPVCGMEVDAGKSGLTVNLQGISYHFCAEDCRNAFEKDPANYLRMHTKKRKSLWNRYLKKLEKATANGSIKCH